MITKEIYAKRRELFFQQMKPNSIAILSASPAYLRNNDIEFPFRQSSDLLYLTGFTEPESIAVFNKTDKGNQFILFCLERNPEIEQWVGYRFGQKNAIGKFGANEAYSIDEADQHIPGLLQGKEYVYYAYGRHEAFDSRMLGWMNQVRAQLRSGINIPNHIINIESITHEMRLIKSEEEIALMQEAVDINIRAFKTAIKKCRPGIREYEVAAELEYQYKKQGATELAFSLIVGTGEHGTILHYEPSDAELKSGELVLIDAGCAVGHYCSDITRTLPVNGKYSKEQRAIYELVLNMQFAGLEQLRPGNSYYAAQEAAIHVATEGLCALGILKGEVSQLIEAGAYKPFYMHKFGHWIGIDVHDPSVYKVEGAWRALKPGMVLSAEPGIYIQKGIKGVDSKWWNIGIRIEDDVLITQTGHRVLTAALPKMPDELEALMVEKS